MVFVANIFPYSVISTIEVVINSLTCLGSVGAVAVGIWAYYEKCKKDHCDKLKNQLSELKYCTQQISNASQKEAIAVLSKELATTLLNTHDNDILKALLETATIDTRTSRLEPILYLVIQNNEDIQHLHKISDRIQLLLGNIKLVLPIYGELLSQLFTTLVVYKQRITGISRLMYLFEDFHILRQLSYQLTREKGDPLTEELFINILYQALIDNSTSNPPLLDTETFTLLQDLIIKLLDSYLLLSNKTLTTIVNKQAEKTSILRNNTPNNTTLLWNNISENYSKEEQQYIFSRLSILLNKVNITDSKMGDNI